VLQIEKIIGSLPYGNSKPIKIVADDKKTYILKFRKDHLNGKDRSNTNEYIAYKLIEHFKLKIAPQKLELIEIDDLAITLAENSNISKESLAYMKASKGINIAIEFLDNARKSSKSEIDNLTFIKAVRTIDNIMLNDDRDIDNTNILRDQTKKNQYYAIDWGLSLNRAELYSDVKTGAINNCFMKLQNIDIVNTPYYIFKDIQGFISVDNKDIEGIIREIVESIPQEWETAYCAETIIELLTSRVQNKIK
jgi:hypothetical protein